MKPLDTKIFIAFWHQQRVQLSVVKIIFVNMTLAMIVLFSTTSTYAESAEIKASTTPPKTTLEKLTILSWGDSLSAAYGIPVEEGWVNLLKNKLQTGSDAEKKSENPLPAKNYHVVNGSISGETTQGGLTRLPDALALHKPDIVLLELGANDGLRGINPRVTKANLEQMITLIHATGAKVVLLGIKIPPNYGPVFSQRFEAAFKDLAEEYELAFHPFFLEGVALNEELMQADGLHPTSEAQGVILDTVWSVFEGVID